MIKHADLHAVSKVFGQTTVGFSISFGPSRTSFGCMTQPVVLFSLASSGFLRVSGTTSSVSRAWSGSVLSFFCFLFDFCTCRVGHLECACLMPHISNFKSKFSKTSATPTAGRYKTLQCICKLFLSVWRKSGHLETETLALISFPFDVNCLSSL